MNDRQERDAADRNLFSINGLYDPREDLIEEEEDQLTKLISKCYLTKLSLNGITTKAIIETGAETTCISEEFLNENKEVFKHRKLTPVKNIAVKGIRQNHQTEK